MYIQQETYLIKNYSFGIHIAKDCCGISYLLIDSKYSLKLRNLMAMYGSYSDSHITQFMTFHVREILSDDYDGQIV